MDKKTILGAVALVVVIGGSWLLYNGLKDRVATPELPVLQSEPSEAQPADIQESEPPDEKPQERIKAPDFTVSDAEGNDVKLSDWVGKPVVLNFWASWCPPCKSEMPEFNLVYEELGEGVQFMMVDAVDGSRETKEKGAAYIAEQGFSFPVYYDTTLEAVTEYGIRALPTSIFIDSEGYIVTGVEGAISEAALRKGITLIMEAVTTAEYHKISPREAKSIMDGGEAFILLDVRTESEYIEKRIDGAVLIPDSEITARAETDLPDKNAAILVYCRSGRRSADVSKALVEMGYTQVYDFGGILDWPYDTVSG